MRSLSKGSPSSLSNVAYLTKYRLRIVVILLIVLGLAFSNCFVHLPRKQREGWGIWQPILEEAGNLTADYTDRFNLTGRDVVIDYGKPIPHHQTLGFPIWKGEPAPKDIQILKRKGFTIGYSNTLKHPVWVMYTITSVDRTVSSGVRPTYFSKDPDLGDKSPQHRDYVGSGYDRGHNAPNYAIATRYGKDAQLQTFFMSNISPQKPNLNQGPWVDVEKRLANGLSARYETIHVIVGSVPSKPTKRLKSGVEIPKGFYQIAYTQVGEKLYAFALYMSQTIERHAVTRGTFYSIDELEELTGLDFFPRLKQEDQVELEGGEATRFWPSYSFEN